MLGNQPANPNGTFLPASGTISDIWNHTAGKTSYFTQSTVPEKDRVLGERRGAPFAVDTVRVPTIPLYLVFKDTGGSAQVLRSCSLENITSFYIDKIHITGITGTPPVLVVKFNARSAKHLNAKSLVVSYEACVFQDHQDVVIVEGNSSPVHTVTFQQPKMVNLYRKPVNIEEISVSLQDLNGVTVPYDTLLLTGFLETQHWQF
jgi:hypothetical protein